MKRILTIITDDLDGSEDAEEVEFSVNGTIFRIDLASKNKAAFEAALAPYTSRAQVVKKAVVPTRTTRIRSWAKANGYPVQPKGRLPRDLIEAYNRAH